MPRTAVQPISSSVFGLCLVLLAGCGVCPDSVLSVATSTDKSIEAVVYSKNCGGAVGGTNLHVKVGPPGGEYIEVLDAYETPFIAQVVWRGNRDLEVVIDCPSDPTVLCAVAGNRAWDISKRSNAGDVRISFQFGPRLAASKDADPVQRKLR